MINEEIEKFLNSFSRATVATGTSKFWPANPPQMDSYWCEIFVKNLMKVGLKEEKLPNIEILRNVLGNYLIIGLKTLALKKIITKEELLDFISKYFEVMKKKTHNDIFCSNFTNKVLTQREVEKILKEHEFEEVKDSKEIGFLHSLLFSYASATCFDVYIAHGFRMHGPYDVSDFFGSNSLLIIREFYDFKEGVWKQKKMERVTTFSIYKNNEMKIDFWNHLIPERPLVETLAYFSSVPSFSELELNQKEISSLILQQVQKVNSMQPQEIILKSAEINFTSFSRLFNKNVIEEMLKETRKNIKKFGLRYWKVFEKLEQKPEKLRITFDPRKLEF